MKLYDEPTIRDYCDTVINSIDHICDTWDSDEQQPLEVLKIAVELRKANAFIKIADALSGHHDISSDCPAIAEAITMLADAVSKLEGSF